MWDCFCGPKRRRILFYKEVYFFSDFFMQPSPPAFLLQKYATTKRLPLLRPGCLLLDAPIHNSARYHPRSQQVGPFLAALLRGLNDLVEESVRVMESGFHLSPMETCSSRGGPAKTEREVERLFQCSVRRGTATSEGSLFFIITVVILVVVRSLTPFRRRCTWLCASVYSVVLWSDPKQNPPKVRQLWPTQRCSTVSPFYRILISSCRVFVRIEVK